MTDPPLLAAVKLSLPSPVHALPHVAQLINDLLAPLTIDAVLYKDLHRVVRVHETSRPATVGAMNGAAGLGRLKLLQWLRGNRSEGCSAEAFNQAAAKNRLQVLYWLYEWYFRKCNLSDAITAAASAGHLKAVKFLVSKSFMPRQDLTPAAEAAAAKGHLQIMEFYLKYRGITDFRLALAQNNQVEVLRLILGSVSMWYSISEALEKGAAMGHVDVVELLLQHRNADAYGAYNAMTLAAQGGHNQVVVLLLPKCEEFGVARALAAAVMGKRRDTVELLVPHCARTAMGFPVNAAADSSQVELLELLLTNCAPEQEQSYLTSENIRRAVVSAAERDDVKVLKLLMTKCGDNIREAMTRAVAKHNLGAVQLLLDFCKTKNDLYLIQAGLEEAVHGGNIEMVKLISSQASPYGIANV